MYRKFLKIILLKCRLISNDLGYTCNLHAMKFNSNCPFKVFGIANTILLFSLWGFWAWILASQRLHTREKIQRFLFLDLQIKQKYANIKDFTDQYRHKSKDLTRKVLNSSNFIVNYHGAPQQQNIVSRENLI